MKRTDLNKILSSHPAWRYGSEASKQSFIKVHRKKIFSSKEAAETIWDVFYMGWISAVKSLTDTVRDEAPEHNVGSATLSWLEEEGR